MRESARRLLDDLLQACRRHYGESLISVVVFGSWARDTATPQSDLDVLIVADPLPKGRLARVSSFEAVEQMVESASKDVWGPECPPVSISPIFKTPQEVEAGSPLFLDMTQDALILFDRNDFFAGYLQRLRARMAELGTQRVQTRGGYYWLYKPDAKPRESIRL